VKSAPVEKAGDCPVCGVHVDTGAGVRQYVTYSTRTTAGHGGFWTCLSCAVVPAEIAYLVTFWPDNG
jgi:hypothetical protein